MLNGGLACLTLVLGFAATWLYLILRKLRRLEDKEIIDEAYGDAKKKVDSSDIQSLIDDSNKRKGR